MGKSVLSKRLEEIATDEEGWLTSRVQAEPRHNTGDDLSELILGLCHDAELQISRTARIRETMKGVTASARGLVRVTWQDVEVSLGPGGGADRHRGVVKALFDVALAADQHGYSGYLLMLDEAQVIRDHREREGQHPLSLLIAAVNSLRLAGADERKAVDRCGRPTRTVRGSVRRSVCQRLGAGHRELQFNRAGVHIYEKVAVELTVTPVDHYPALAPFNKEFRL